MNQSTYYERDSTIVNDDIAPAKQQMEMAEERKRREEEKQRLI